MMPSDIKNFDKTKKIILVAEDEPNILELIKLILDEKYNLVLAEDGKEVFEKLKNVTPDLILLDVMMPYMNGFEVCEKLKNDSKTKSIKIAMLSAKGQEQDIVQGLQLGADYYITKPFDPIDLEEKIEEILR